MILVQAVIDEETKSSAEKWLMGQGIVPDEAIRMFYREVVACHGLPFGGGRRRDGAVIEPGNEPVFYEEISAVGIASVTGELREAHSQGRDLLGRLKEFKEQRALRKAARKAGRRNAAGNDTGDGFDAPQFC
ncbi:MAG TPA: type II toxin-antitoxin system RelB/DinJ family antitoxin [Luteolibacter sp.]|nr:type II toxin-antitoxin system RelB/DinJ family antitoxin [Luteolibacter sp.]